MAPPIALLLEGGERLTSSALSSLGWYKLDERRIGGRPVWRHAVHADRWLAFDGEAWLCQTTDCLGQARGMLQLPDPKCASPDQSLMPWKSPKEHSSTGWTVQPNLTCVAKSAAELASAMRPPTALLLASGRDLPLDVAVDCLGWYRLSPRTLGEWVELSAEAIEKSPGLAGSPVWTHMVHDDRWISCSDSGWWAQEKRNLGTSVGWLQLPCLSSPAPPASFQSWKMWDGKGWITQPLITCVTRTEEQLQRAIAPHPAILLDCSVKLSSQAASDLGW
eukprot:scaffold32557_cov99-Isochrysis_galbana.AAC.1